MLLYTILFSAGALMMFAEAKTKTVTCPIKPYTDIDLSKVAGTWYAVRGIEHTSQKQTSRQRNNKSCPVITLAVKDATHLEFHYDSKNGSESRRYNMTVRDTAVPSVWVTEKGNKKQVPFGKLQVNDMTGNTMALTMCGTHRLASVILFKEKRFEPTVVEEITQRLAAKGLNTTRSFDRCKT